MCSTDPTSSGRTTCRSSMKKTDTFAAFSSSSIWCLSLRFEAFVKRFQLCLRIRCDSSQMQHVDLVGLRLLVGVEVLELHRAACADDLPQGLGERLRARRVVCVVPLEQQIGHQVDGDDGLPRSRAATDDEDRLLAIVEALARAVERLLVDDELLVEEHVGRISLDDSSRRGPSASCSAGRRSPRCASARAARRPPPGERRR